MTTRGKIQTISVVIAMAFLGSLLPSVFAQDRDRDRDDRDRDRLTRLEPGTIIPVRNDESIDVERKDNRVYRGTVDQDVRGENGRLAIPRGSEAEMIVRVAPDNDLVIDIESVTVDRRRFAVQTDSNRQESERDNSLVGGIIGAIQGGQARGRAVRIPRDTVLTFRLARPMVVGVPESWRRPRRTPLSRLVWRCAIESAQNTASRMARAHSRAILL